MIKLILFSIVFNFMVLYVSANDKKHEVIIYFFSEKSENLSLYYRESGIANFSENRKINKKILEGRNQIKFEFKPEINLEFIRFDFGYGDDQFDIDSIVYNKHNKYFKMNPKQIIKYSIFNQFMEWEICEDNISIKTIKGDPFFLIKIGDLMKNYNLRAKPKSLFYIKFHSEKDFLLKLYYLDVLDTNQWFVEKQIVTEVIIKNEFREYILPIPEHEKLSLLRIDFGNKIDNKILIKEMALVSRQDHVFWTPKKIIQDFHPNRWVTISETFLNKDYAEFKFDSLAGYPNPFIFQTEKIIYELEYKKKVILNLALILIVFFFIFYLNKIIFSNSYL